MEVAEIMADFPKLVVLSEKFRGMSFKLDRDSLSAGRNAQRDICIKDGSVSSYHCDFVHNDDGYFIVDRGSTNGTRLNNVPLTPEEPAALKNSDLLQLGNVEVMFDFDDGSSPMVSRTETGIDFASADTRLSTVKDFSNLSPFAGSDSKNEERNRKLLIGGGIAVVALILILLVIFIIKMFMDLSVN